MSRLSRNALTSAAAYSSPGTTSLGAIQQRMPRDSSVAHTASAVGLSFDE